MNYREAHQSNDKKTNFVMAIYLLIFTFIGLLGDSLYYLSDYPDTNLSDILYYIITFQSIPVVTPIFFGIAAVIIWVAISFGSKIMLSGNEYKNLDESDELTLDEQQIVNIVEELLISARIRFRPKIYILEADYMNAFASGWTEDNSMVCITRGLMNALNREEIEAVMAHELAHIRNHDIKLTLMVGILTNVMVYAVDVMFYFFGRDSRSKAAGQIKIILFLLKIILPVITIILQLYISRKREYMADAGAVEFTGNPEAMANALEKISGHSGAEESDDERDNQTRKFAYINGSDGFFSTHPSIENRIKALRGTARN